MQPRPDSETRRRLTAAVAVVALAASLGGGTLSGCSETGDLSDKLNKAQYVLELKALVKRVTEQTMLAAELISVDSLAEAAPLIEEAVAEFDEIVARLEEIEPPEEVAAIHDRLTAALGSASELLTDAQGALESNDIASLILLAPQLSDFRERFRGLVEDYSARGYELDRSSP